jgi:tRNA dimethylallyltransferase
MTTDQPSLVVIAGPTAVGKTTAALSVATSLHSEIVSADARQFYRELKIGTAPPAPEDLLRIKHHLVGHLSVTDAYNIGLFEKDALKILEELFQKSGYAVLVGGSGLYIHALCHGIDQLPEQDPAMRKDLEQQYQAFGIRVLQQTLKTLDPAYYEKVDLNNPSRLIRAIEVSMITGKPYSQFRKEKAKTRPFRILKIGLDLPREQLYCRIDDRVDEMIRVGLVEEARSMLPFRHCNALNTVGYRELFDHFDGKTTLDEAISLIKQHTRNYAKRQLTWFRRDRTMNWFHPEDLEGITNLCRQSL